MGALFIYIHIWLYIQIIYLTNPCMKTQYSADRPVVPPHSGRGVL
jgi:hypothetical protein